MCGIVGLFLKDNSLEPRLGELTAGMLSTMCDRGPDSAGFAVYGPARKGNAKITLQSPDPARDFAGLCPALARTLGAEVSLIAKSSHAVLSVPAEKADAARAALRAEHPRIRIMSSGQSIEIYKEVGYPTDVSSRFGLEQMAGSHAIGRPAWRRSAVTTLRHLTGPDQCLVPTAVSNHNNLRRAVVHDGMTRDRMTPRSRCLPQPANRRTRRAIRRAHDRMASHFRCRRRTISLRVTPLPASRLMAETDRCRWLETALYGLPELIRQGSGPPATAYV
jgi:hypothetical protein